MENEKKKRKAGRPIIGDKLEHLFQLRISKTQKEILEKKAKEEEGKTMSGIVRELIESAPGAPRMPDPEDWKKMTPKEKEEWIKSIQE